MRQHPTSANGKYSKIQAWDSPTGASLCVYHKMPTKAPRAVIHINHGLAEHGGRYGRFANRLARAGFVVYAQDHRGHGATTAPDSDQGIFASKDGWEKTLADMQFVNGEIRKRHPTLPVIIFGHSMGAILAYQYLLRWPDSVDAAALWNAAMSKTSALKVLKFILALEGLVKPGQAASILTPLTFGGFNKKISPRHTSVDWLTKDIAEAKAYIDDPDCGWPASLSMWKDIATGLDVTSSDIGLEAIPKTMPLFVLGGNDDPSVDFGKAVTHLSQRFTAAGLVNVTTQIRENGRHEALNEPKAERDAVMRNFIDWALQASS